MLLFFKAYISLTIIHMCNLISIKPYLNNIMCFGNKLRLDISKLKIITEHGKQYYNQIHSKTLKIYTVYK